MSKKKTTPAKETNAQSIALREFWRAGRDSLVQLDKLKKDNPRSLRYGKKKTTHDAEAKRLEMNVDTAAKAQNCRGIHRRGP